MIEWLRFGSSSHPPVTWDPLVDYNAPTPGGVFFQRFVLKCSTRDPWKVSNEVDEVHIFHWWSNHQLEMLELTNIFAPFSWMIGIRWTFLLGQKAYYQMLCMLVSGRSVRGQIYQQKSSMAEFRGHLSHEVTLATPPHRKWYGICIRCKKPWVSPKLLRFFGVIKCITHHFLGGEA